jgi:hypothetical protein
VAPAAEPDLDQAVAALADLRRARRARRVASINAFEAFYRAYVTAILAGVALWLLSGVVGGARVTHHQAAQVMAHGPAAVGLAVAVVLAVGLRSGGQGGPLALEAADVRHVLLAPIDRTVALRPQAWRQMRFGALVGAGVGALCGLLAYRRLPGDPVAWVACGAAVGAVAVLGAFGLALTTSGARVGRYVGSFLALLVVGWSAADLAKGTTTSPMTLLGQVAVWPLRFRTTGLLGAAVLAVPVVTGMALVGGTSIEAAERRSSLVGQLRFAATLRDLRTVVVLRRQLAQELPRQRPWLRLSRAVHPASASRHRRLPVWRRSWHGILRFPALRLGRLALLGALAGLAELGAWRGTKGLVVAAGLALYVAALDAVEPAAQESDHPDRRDGYGLESGELYLRQAGPSLVVMVLVCLVGAGAAAVAGGGLLGFEVGAVMAVPAAAAATTGALMSTVQGPPAVFSSTDSLVPPELSGIRNLVRTVLPPVVAIVGVLPVLSGRHPRPHLGHLGATAAVLPEVLFVALLAAAWVRYREAIAEWWRQSQEQAGALRRPPGPAGSRR